ncbi:general secretion pathway protein GspL [Roseateles sp. DAIF2]|uniref:type II secretion system protein GspL n=1 Tax=Roseateles sp. DAIF2 TaxID=2714952 RepID=UPI0018A2CE43|nr:type II secretion system protein GspL [Roseateles sp. DAIF2]QPF72515.1 general secretion pathway protein GspL [Roseateles sp. DAIF2]
MSTLILLLPQRSRLRAQGRNAPPADAPRAEAGREYDFVLSLDGRHVESQGRAAPALLPRADTVLAVPAEADIGWQRLTLPRAGRGKLRAALGGLLEEALLDDTEQLHFAVEPEMLGGEPAWVAVTHRGWLQEQLAQLEAAQVFVDRIVPLSWPDEHARGHFFESPQGLQLRWSHAEGASTLCLAGSLARDLFPPSLVQSAQWSGAPNVIPAAEHWLGTAVPPLTEGERALQALQSPWDLRQFELAPRTRGIRALREFWQVFLSRRWQPVRWGLTALIAVQLLGLNLWAWQQHRQVEERRAALEATLRSAHPQVRAILDAPIQMQRETELLRAHAGRAGEQDFETLLSAAATAWPPERGPVDALSFETGRLQLSATGWTEAQIQQFRHQLQSEGWQLDVSDGRMALSRARTL